MGPEQSPEHYHQLLEDIDDAKQNDQAQVDRIQHPNLKERMYHDPLIAAIEMALERALGLDAAGAERKLQQYMDEGRAEAIELNEAFNALKYDVEQARADLQEYSETHRDVVNETTPAYQQLKARAESAIDALRAFEVDQLGVSTKEERAEAA